MPTGTVTNTLTLPDGTTPPNVYVKIELVASTATPANSAYITATGAQVDGLYETSTATGTWSAALNTNASLTPANTYYRVTQVVYNSAGHSSTYVDTISVTGSGSVSSMLVSVPTDLATAATTTTINNAIKSAAKGLLPPNNSVPRLFKPTVTMASPPAIVVSTANGTWPASSIVSPVSVLFINNPAFRVTDNSGPFIADGFGFYDLQGIPASLYNNQSVIDFMFDGQKLEYAFKSRGASYGIRMLVDGEYVSTTPSTTGTLNWQGYAFVDFGSRAVRHITIEVDTTNYYGINIGPNDTIWYPTHIPAQPKVFLVCESLGATTTSGPAIAHDCWWGWVARRFGWSVWASAASGTGYLNPGTFGGTVRTRVNQMASSAPDVWVLAAGVNDGGYSSAAVTAECVLTFAAAKAGAPASKLVVVGPWGSSGPASAARVATRDAVLAAVNAAGSGVDAFIDPIALGFITGTGRVGATTGTGNADLYIGSDGIHPTTAGHRYMGDRMVGQLATVVDSLVLK